MVGMPKGTFSRPPGRDVNRPELLQWSLTGQPLPSMPLLFPNISAAISIYQKLVVRWAFDGMYMYIKLLNCQGHGWRFVFLYTIGRCRAWKTTQEICDLV
jgi:hypothetical protein